MRKIFLYEYNKGFSFVSMWNVTIYNWYQRYTGYFSFWYVFQDTCMIKHLNWIFKSNLRRNVLRVVGGFLVDNISYTMFVSLLIINYFITYKSIVCVCVHVFNTRYQYKHQIKSFSYLLIFRLLLLRLRSSWSILKLFKHFVAWQQTVISFDF